MIKFLKFETHQDERGSLISLESNKNIPFDIKRVYYIFKNGADVIRGQHAHKKLKQIYIVVSGSCKVILDDGNKKEIITLDNPDIGMVFDRIIWRELFDFSQDCVLMVLADDFYDEEDCIRNYEEFLKYKKKNDRV